MSLNKIIIKHKNSSIHEEPLGNDLKFRFLEQTKEVVSDKHLKSLFETGDKPTGVDFELFINSKVHQDDFKQAGQEIEEKLNTLNQDLRNEITKTSNEVKDLIDNLDEELSFDIAEHTSNADIHFTNDERVEVAKIPSIEQSINNINSILGSTTRQHIVSTLDDMYLLENVIHGDICYVIDERKTYMYDDRDLVGDGEESKWIKISNFETLASADWSVIENKPEEFNPTKHTHTMDEVENLTSINSILDTYSSSFNINTNSIRTQKDFLVGSVEDPTIKAIGTEIKLNGEPYAAHMTIQSTHGRPSLCLKLKKDGINVGHINLSANSLYPEKSGEIDLGLPTGKFNNLYSSGSGFFDGFIQVKSGSSILYDDITNQGLVIFESSDGTKQAGYIGKDASNDGLTVRSTNGDLRLNTQGEAQAILGNTNNHLYTHFGSKAWRLAPNVSSNGMVNLGSDEERFKALYCTTAVNVSSDMSLKENIKYVQDEATISEGSDAITKQDAYDFIRNTVKIAEYNYINKNKDGDRIEPTQYDYSLGFIANDLEGNKVGDKILTKENDLLSYNTQSYTGALTLALQKAMQKIENLEARIQELESK